MKENSLSLKTNKLPILITAIGGGGHGEQILKAIRLAKGDRYHVVGADANPNCRQFALVEEHVSLPLASDHSYIDSLLAACKQYKIRALFHGCEPELKLFAAHRDLIEQQDIFLPVNPLSVIQTCMNKEETNRHLEDLGFEPPRFIRVSSKESLKQIDWFPVVVKPSIGSGGSADVYIAQNTTELVGLADYLGLEVIADNFLVQEYVGTPDVEYTVGVLHDMDGNYLNSIAVRRLLSGQLNIRMSVPNRTNRQELGPKLVISSGVSHGYVGRFPEVTDQCRDIAKALGAKGPINIQCRLVDGEVKVFEINPRFSGTTSIRAMVGYNEPDILIRKHVFGENIESDFPYLDALILRGLVEHFV
jgi:carbamoyl-phosphate synthase large subunit